jgi:hypothetical protein
MRLTMMHPSAAIVRRRRALLFALAGGALVRLRPSHAGGLEMAAVPDPTRAALLARARALGRLPIIVGLAIPRGSELGAARARLLGDLGVTVTAGDGSLASPGVTNVKPLETIPFLALTVEPAALERLLAHPLVDSVQEDAAAPPL